jgi:hypothetical protein
MLMNIDNRIENGARDASAGGLGFIHSAQPPADEHGPT